MPVVAVNDIRNKIIQMKNAFQNCLGEEGNAFAVIKLSIDLASLEIVLVIQEIVPDSFVLHAEQSAVLASPTKRYGEGGNKFHLLDILFRN